MHNGYSNKVTQNTNGSYDLKISYKDGWTDAQRAAADAKIAALNNSNMLVSIPNRGTTSAADIFRNAGFDIPTGSDIDHILYIPMKVTI